MCEFNPILQKIQENKSTPQENNIIVKEFDRRYRPHKITNYLFKQDELKSEYMIACWEAIFRAKLNVGNPIMFCIRRGYGAMLDYYRSTSSKNLLKICPKCNISVAYDRRNINCKICGTEYKSIEKYMRYEDYITGKCVDDIIETIVIRDTFERLHSLIKSLTFPKEDIKQVAIEAVNIRIGFYECAQTYGYNISKSKSIENCILNTLKPYLNNF